MKIILLISFLQFTGLSCVYAKCGQKNNQKLIEKSSKVFLGEIVEFNKETPARVYDLCKKNRNESIDLVYKIKPKMSMKDRVSLSSQLTLKYQYVCNRRPANQVFEKNKEYIFAAKEIRENQVKLVGYLCGYWGWEIKDMKIVYSHIAPRRLTEVMMCLDSGSLEKCVDCCTDRAWPVARNDKTVLHRMPSFARDEKKIWRFINQEFHREGDFTFGVTGECRDKCIDKYSRGRGK